MVEVLGVVGLGAVVFASTNVDDIFLLLLFFSDHSLRGRHVVLGQYAGISALVAFSVAASLVALVVPSEWIGLLGLAPIAIGVRALLDLRGDGSNDDALSLRPGAGAASRIAAVAAVTIANGGDNIGVYVPLFATSSGSDVAVMVVVFLVLTGIWCVAARYLAVQSPAADRIQRFGHLALPVVLIGLGIWILSHARLLVGI